MNFSRKKHNELIIDPKKKSLKSLNLKFSFNGSLKPEMNEASLKEYSITNMNTIRILTLILILTNLLTCLIYVLQLIKVFNIFLNESGDNKYLVINAIIRFGIFTN